MPRQRLDNDVYYPASRHFNVRCEGDFIFNRITLRDFKELRAESIQWVWCVEERRELTKKEIVKLCSAKA